MNATLKQFLHEQVAKNQIGKAEIDEWRSAVERLFIQIRGWLKEADPEGVIEIDQTDEFVNEPGLGRYRVARLNLRVLGKWIGIIPKARRTIGTAKPPEKSAPARADGRVDITDEVRRYVLYRIRQGEKDVWMIDNLDYAYEQKTWPGQAQ